MPNNVYIYSPTRFYGGGEIFQVRLAALLSGYRNIVSISPPLPQLQQGLAEHGADFIELSSTGKVGITLRFLKWLLENRRSIHHERAPIVLNGKGAAYLAPFVVLCAGIAPIVICHTEIPAEPQGVKDLLYSFAIRFCERVVAVSETTATQFRGRWQSVPVTAVPNWLTKHTYESSGNEKDTTVKNSFGIATVSRLEPFKGVEDVIEACIGQSLCLNIYGDGSLYGKLVKKYGDKSGISFFGHVNDVPKRLSSHAIFVSGSYSESFSYSVAEAIIAGLLCVVSDIPAHCELLGPDYPEVLFFKPGNVDQIKMAILNAKSMLVDVDGEAADNTIRAARKRIEKRNSAEMARKGYLEVLTERGVRNGFSS